jgi:hypothetical protein
VSAPAWSLLLSLLAPLLAGVVALRALGMRWQSDRLAFAGWAWVTGALLAAALTLVWVVAGRPIAGRWLAPALALASALLLVLPTRARPRSVAPCCFAKSRERLLLNAALGALLVLGTSAALAATTAPALAGDEAAIWAAKAKALYASSGYVELYRDLHARVCHSDYPMLNPLLQAWMFAGSGEILDFHGRLPIHACAIAAVCILAAGLRRILRPGIAAAVLMLFFTQRVVLDDFDCGNSDLMVALGAITSLDAWLRARAGDARCWPLACVGLMVLVWTKNEGMPLAMLLAAWFVLDGRRLPHRAKMPLAWLALPGAAIAVNAAFSIALELPNDIVAWDDPARFLAQLKDRVARCDEVAGALGQRMLATDSRWLVVGFLGLLLLFPRRLARTPALPMAVTAGALLLLYGMVFLASPHDLDWHLDTASPRLLLHVSALAPLGLAVALATLWPRLARATG